VPDNIKFYFNKRNNIYVENDLVFLENRIMVPKTMEKLILSKLHDSHLGIVKTKSRAKMLFYWPNMNNEIEDLITKCKVCEKYSFRNCKQPMIIEEQPELPFQKIGCDILDYKSQSYLVLGDYYSKWIEIIKFKSKNSENIIKVLKIIFSIHGIPNELRADIMPFNSTKMKQFSEEWDFIINTSSPYYPKRNGFAEKLVEIAKQMLKKSEESKIELHLMLMEYRRIHQFQEQTYHLLNNY